MSAKITEILIPDGDGEKSGINAAELHANYANEDGSLRTTDSQDEAKVEDTTATTPVKGSKMLYADRSYTPAPVLEDESSKQERRNRVATLPRGWMSGFAGEAGTYVDLQQRRHEIAARRSGRVALQLRSGGNYIPPIR